MRYRTNDSRPSKKCDVLFQSEYGGIPKYVLYGFIPFLLIGAGILLVRAVGFNAGILIKGFKISPELVTFVVCPVIMLPCILIMVLGIYRRSHPQQIVVTDNGLILPKGRFTAEVIRIRWHDLTATIWSGTISFMDVYEITCLDSEHAAKISIASNMFRDFDDFATFALIVGEHMGEDWSIKGFLPGAIRGNQKQARLASGRIRSREDT